VTVEYNTVEDIYPLSPMQEGMLFHTLYEPDTGVYFQQLRCTLRGELDVAAFMRAWQQLADRHPILRTAFVWEESDQPLQVVHRQVELPWEQQDWRGLTPAAQHERFEAWLLADRRQGFELDTPPLMRFGLFRIADTAYSFVWSHHHLLLDGWSMPLVFDEVFTCYDAFRRRRAVRLERVRPYRDYIAWLQQQSQAQAESFWRQTLRGFSTPTPLLFDRPAADGDGPHLAELRARLPEATTAALQAFARQHQLTLNTIAQGAWALLLSRYSGEEDVLFGATVAGRPAGLPGIERTPGLFINTLPVRLHVDPRAGVATWLKGVQAQQAALRQYEHTPLVQIQAWSEVAHGSALFESLLVFENYPLDSSTQPELAGLAVQDVRFAEATNYPITLEVAPGRQLALVISYDRRRFDAGAMARALRHLQTLFEGIASGPDRPTADLPLLSAEERQQLLVEWNATGRAFSADLCVHQLFEAQAARTPEATALIVAGRQVSYRELNQRANQVAHYLRGLGVGPESRVGIFMERSLDLLTALLGILKAGGAYAALDPAYPQQRLALMLQEAQLELLLTAQEQRTKTKEKTSTGHKSTTDPLSSIFYPLSSTIDLTAEWPTIAQQSTANPESGVTPEHPVYLIFTSGSTGTPKAVVALHRSLANLAQAIADLIEVGPGDRLLHFLPFSFDASAVQLFPSLVRGGAVLIHHDPAGLSNAEMTSLCQANAISILDLPTVRWQQWVEELAAQGQPLPAKVRLCATGGEKPPLETLRRWARLTDPQGVFINSYGPTEATVTTTVFRTRAAQIETLAWRAATSTSRR
jgi:non-ribosomal peptide synthetase component F